MKTLLFLLLPLVACEDAHQRSQEIKDILWAREKVNIRNKRECDEYCVGQEKRVTYEYKAWVCTCEDGRRRWLSE